MHLSIHTRHCRVPPGRQAVLKVAGIKRSTVASCLLAVGGMVAVWTGASRTVSAGLALGAILTGVHAMFRTPNLKARLSSAQHQMANGGHRDIVP
jgi:hypothetical protein